MKKIFTMMAAALVSTAMWAGANDLLWDYTEAKIPTTAPDRGLYYGGYVNDAPSTNLGLNGVKMNSSGYAYFTKAAVAGKLKLTFGPRKAGNSLKLGVSTWAGETPAAETLIKETTSSDEYRTEIIELTAEQTNIYINRPSGTGEGVLQKIQFVEDVARTFVDFEMEMCNMASEYDFSTLPEGVTASGTFNNDQHGYRNFTITVPVDGTVRFTLGDCQYGNKDIPVKNKAGETIASLKYPAAGCYSPSNTGNVLTYIYLGDADTLTFGPIQYCNYFKAEAAEITPCDVIFKDQNGTELGRIETYEGASLTVLPYDMEDLPAIVEGNVFRGWYYTNGKKAVVGDVITGNTTIQAKVTPIETATIGSVQTYNFTSSIFYPENHETVTANGGSFHDPTHGWYFNADGSIDIQVAGNAIVNVTLCTYSESGDVILKNGETEIGRTTVVKNGTEGATATPDGTEYSYKYTGDATTLTLSWTAKQYIHSIVVYNVLDFLEKDAATGYFIVPAGDAACFLLALVQAESGDKIFLPNGIYDLGETVLTPITKNNISIIGQSMEGVIIKNKAITPGIGATATLLIEKNVTNTYLQDLTLQNTFDYYKTNDGVAVALQDKGTKTICKNVRLLSYQDTYYSNLQGALKYFETSEIHGTVDFICGDGSVYFKNTELICEQRSTNGGGQDALTASNSADSDKGYVFEGCSVRYADNIEGNKPVISLGRSWNNKPKTVFLNTLLADDLVLTKDADKQKDKIQRWTCGGMNILPEKFGEYNSVNAAGQVVSPESNNVTFVLNNDEKQMETILTAEEAATYTMEYTLGAWAETAKADATQAVALPIAEDGIYLVENPDGNCFITTGEILNMADLVPDATIRRANARGGFGLKAGEEPKGEGVVNTAASNAKTQAVKTVKDGQIIIVRDGKAYNMLGAQL
ncbi:MAG: hypothetical protein IJ249_08550 [Paludibacteraceae bacterium]|nr:hypothetical protein [Paludibacteraceae bacterium]